MKSVEKERPITAQPVGAGFRVLTTGLFSKGARRDLRADAPEQEDESENFLAGSSGCYRRYPTCKD